MDIKHDVYGRMTFHPDFHFNQKKPWTTTDQKYLIDMYESVGPDQIAMALGRTIHTVMQKAYELRKKGLMPKRSIQKNFRRNNRA